MNEDDAMLLRMLRNDMNRKENNRSDENYPDLESVERKVFSSFINLPIDCDVLIAGGVVFKKWIPLK